MNLKAASVYQPLTALLLGAAGMGSLSAESFLENLPMDTEPGLRVLADSIDAIQEQSMLRFALRETGATSDGLAVLPGSVSLAGEEQTDHVKLAMEKPDGGAAAGGGNAEAQANNPLANMTAFNIQNYYIGELTGPGSDDANQLWLRYARPFTIGESSWLLRVSLPLNTFPTPPNGSTSTGLGDINAFAAYLFNTGNPAISIGFGPQITLPTATDNALGSEKWSAGFAHVLFDARNPKFQWGYLLTWQHSVAGTDNRPDVNLGALQPFAFYQLGEGWYLRAAPDLGL